MKSIKKKDVPTVIGKIAGECVSCGLCTNECSLLRGLGDRTVKDVAENLVSGKITDTDHDFIVRCSLCGLCGKACPLDLDIAGMVREGRGVMMENGDMFPESYRYLWVDHDDHYFSIFREHYKTDQGREPWMKDSCGTLFFPGCTLSAESPELVKDCLEWLGKTEDVGMIGLTCCGATLSEIGLTKRSDDYSKGLAKAIRKTGAKRIVTACHTCQSKLKQNTYLEGTAVESLYTIMADSGIRIQKKIGKVTVHDSCSDRCVQIGPAVRTLLKEQDMVEMAHHGRRTICCGSGGLVSQVSENTCKVRAIRRLKEVDRAGANICVTYCMSCAHRLNFNGNTTEIRHILELVFNRNVNHGLYDRLAKDLWEGEQGERYIERIENSKKLEFL
jgi:Fe-S oxidoreductase